MLNKKCNSLISLEINGSVWRRTGGVMRLITPARIVHSAVPPVSYLMLFGTAHSPVLDV